MSLQSFCGVAVRKCCTRGVVQACGYSNSAHDRRVSAIFQIAKDAQFMAGAATPEQIPSLKGLPEIIVAGRANVGKSTLLNSIMGRSKLANVSKQPGRTQTINFYRVGEEPGKLIIVDAPGYGTRGRPEWGRLFDHYVKHRKELRRIYLLVAAKHGLNESDELMLSDLNQKCQSLSGDTGAMWSMQAIITKTDKLSIAELKQQIPKIRDDVFRVAPTCLPPICVALAKQPYLGLNDVRKSIAEACSL